MKYTYYIWLLGALLSACGSNDYKLYSGEACVQFAMEQDTVQRYTFYFEPAGTVQDTVWFEVITTGYISDAPRSFRVIQSSRVEGENALAGLHYKGFEDMVYEIPANSVTTRVPVVLYRDNLTARTTYCLGLKIVDNECFNAGVKTQLQRTVVFSKDLLKPNGWGKYLENEILGTYSINKHEWMIAQTGQKWDDSFFETLDNEPGGYIYWRDKLNALLVEYRQNGGVLEDDNRNEITGFPE